MYKVQTIILKKNMENEPHVKAAKRFYDDCVQFYMDVLKQLSAFPCLYGLYHEKNPIVKADIRIDEDDAAKKIVIYEKWDEEFESIINPLMEDGFSHVSGMLPPRLIRELVRLIAFGDLIKNQYLERKAELVNLIEYASITRMPDTEDSDGGKITVYRTNMEKEVCYGYEARNRVTGENANIDLLKENPEKKWYLTSPYIYGVILPNFEPDRFPEYVKEYEEMQKQIFIGFESDTGGTYEFEDGKTDNGEFRICDAQMLGADCNGMLTSAQIAECIEKILKAIRAIDHLNRKVCENTSRNYEDYNFGALNVNMLMHSEENEILYIHSDMGAGDVMQFIYQQ